MPSKTATASPTDFFYNLDQKKQHIIALFILFLMPFFLFTAITIGGKELKRHDTTQWRASAESVIEYREEFGEEPLWATNVFGGMPAYVISVRNQTPHLDWLGSFFSNIYPTFRHWIMLSGMYFLLIVMGFRPLPALFGALMYSLTTYFPIIIGAGHATKFLALAYAPWVIAGYWLLSRKEKKLPGLLLFSVAFTLELRAGHPQITYYFFYLIVILWLFDSWNLYKNKDYKNWGLLTGLLLAGGIIGALGHAQSLLTLQEYTAHSIRGGSAVLGSTGLDSGYAFAWSQGIKETFTLLVPALFGGASPEYWGPKSFTSGPHYLGALSLPFILIGLFRQKSKAMWIFFGTGTLAMFFAWGGHFRLLNEFAFDFIPLFDKFRAPETWLVLTIFCYTIVAVYGMSWFSEWVSQKKLPELKQLYLPLGVTAAVVLFLFIQVNTTDYVRSGEIENIANQIARQNQVSPQHPQVIQQAENYVNTRLVPEREEKAKGDMVRMVIILLIGVSMLYFAFRQKISVGVAFIGLVLLLSYDLINVGKRYIPDEMIVAGNMDPERIIESQRRDLDTFIEENISDSSIYPYRVFPLLDNPFNNNIPSYYYPSIGGYTGAKLSIIQDVIDDRGPLFKGDFGINTQLLSLLNVKFLTYQTGLNIPGFTPVFESQSGTVYENQNVLPKAFFVDSVITTTDPVTAYNYLNPGEIDFSETAVVETSEEITTQTDPSSSVEVTRYTGPKISLDVKRSKPGFLVLSEIYYPEGWVAELDGEEIPIYKTDYLLRGLQIPAGEHGVELKFEPDSFRIGVMLGWTSLGIQILLAGFFAFTLFKNRAKSGT